MSMEPYPPRRALRASGVALAAAMLTLAGAGAAVAAEPTPVVIVFDNSGSMWGRIEGERNPKYIVVRDAINQTLAALPAGSPVGLTLLGHRRPGDCSDVEVVQPPEPDSAPRIGARIEKLNPKGRGPLVAALRETARALPAGRPGRLVLIHDDPDNCQADPCALGAEMKTAYPGLAVDVVSIAPRPESLAAMQCLASETGGRLREAKDAPELVAAIQAALQGGGIAHATPVAATRPDAGQRQRAQADARRGATPAREVEETSGPPGLRLSAVLAAGGEPVDLPVKWRVVSLASPTETALYEADEARARLDAPPGRYRIEAKAGPLSATETVEVGPDRPTVVRIALGGGLLRISALAGKSGPALETALVSVWPWRGDGAGQGRGAAPVYLGRAVQHAVLTPPGNYRVVVEHGLVRREHSVAVPAGAAGDLDLDLAAGELAVTVPPAPRRDGPDDALVLIFEDDPDAPQGRREIARSATPRATFQLPAGSYLVVVRRGAAEARERVAIGAGETLRRTLEPGGTRLELRAGLGPHGAAASDVSFRISRIDGGAREIARSEGARESLELSPGRYRIEARLGGHNVASERTVDVAAGRPGEVQIDLPAGLVTLRLADTANLLGLAEAYWEIRDAAGRVVWRTVQTEPKAFLAPGRYVARAEAKSRRVEKVLDVAAGSTTTVELGPL